MKRHQLFEFEDFAWFPDAFRQTMTQMIAMIHRLLGTDALLAPLIARAMQAGGTETVVDLCSGAGGPMPRVAERLRRDHRLARLTLTDLYPNRGAIAAFDAAGDTTLRYHHVPVDAGNVPESLAGARTMVCSFHHMPPDVARRILKDAFDKRQPLCIFEISDNSQPAILALPAFLFSLVVAPVLTLFTRPLTPGRLFFTYVVPLIPVAYAWDAAASNLRTYTVSDLRELIQGLEAPDYQWEIGGLRKPGYPSAMPYLLGLPQHRPAEAHL